jgi:thiamine-phosphate pyrophosphorylase
MRRLYSGCVTGANSLPALWLLSDARNDEGLAAALARLPRGSGFIYRHYHLPDPDRYNRFREMRRIAKARGHVVILADSAMTALEWGADGTYGAPLALWPRRAGLVQLATAHDAREIAMAARKGADAVLLSPVFATRSHPGAAVLGPVRFRLLAQLSPVPVIALGGMTPRHARALDWPRWAAIDGLS